MLTHSDLVKCGDDETKRIEFIEQAMNDFRTSQEYKTAQRSIAYDRKENPDIATVEKIVYDMQGIAHKDLVSANHKIRNGYYPLIIGEAVSHLLANGVTFSNPENKKKLGKDFDDVLKKIYRDALVCRRSYGMWNGEKVIHLPYMNTIYIPDDYNGELTDAIYFTQLASDKPLVVHLYEPDGFSVYASEDNKPLSLLQSKKAYTNYYRKNEAEGKYDIKTENSSKLPIITLNNLNEQSSLIGNLEILIAIDIIMSELCNNVSQAELVYWVLKNYGGMDDIADANFVINLLKTHVIHVNDDGEATPHQITVPVDANNAAYIRLKALLFENMRGANHEILSAGNLTATQIKAAYSRLREFSGEMESKVFEFIRGILDIAGIGDDESFSVEYNEPINATEEINNTIASAPWLGEKATTKKLAALNGLSDELDEIEKDKEAAAMERMSLIAAQNDAQGDSEGVKV